VTISDSVDMLVVVSINETTRLLFLGVTKTDMILLPMGNNEEEGTVDIVCLGRERRWVWQLDGKTEMPRDEKQKEDTRDWR
jgi:hypothetical protein